MKKKKEKIPRRKRPIYEYEGDSYTAAEAADQDARDGRESTQQNGEEGEQTTRTRTGEGARRGRRDEATRGQRRNCPTATYGTVGLQSLQMSEQPAADRESCCVQGAACGTHRGGGGGGGYYELFYCDLRWLLQAAVPFLLLVVRFCSIRPCNTMNFTMNFRESVENIQM